MHMDKSKPIFSSHQLSLHPASAWKRAVVDALSRASEAVTAHVFDYPPFCVFVLAACGPTASQSPADAVSFDK
jgi:hypothetical protein